MAFPLFVLYMLFWNTAYFIPRNPTARLRHAAPAFNLSGCISVSRKKSKL